jgi:hypothetical protein
MTGPSQRNSAPRPPLWLRTSVTAGVVAHCSATALGALLVAIAAGILPSDVATRELALLPGFVLIYLNTHALDHWVVGRLVGIRCKGFTLRGTDHPESYPPGFRQLMSVLPTSVALSDPIGRRAATPRARAAICAAGETSTTVCSILTAV